MPLADKKPIAAVLANMNALNSFSEKFKFVFWAEERTICVWLVLQIINILIFEIFISEKINIRICHIKLRGKTRTYLAFENKLLGALLAPTTAGAKSFPAVANVRLGTKCICALKPKIRLFSKLKAMSLRLLIKSCDLRVMRDV